MFCANCGNNIIPGEKFCGNCGASVSYSNNVEQSQPTEVMQRTGVEQPTEVMQPGIQIAQPEYATPLIKNRKLIIISACVIVAIAIIAAAIFFFTFPHFHKASPTDRIVVPKAKTSQSAQDVVRELQEKGIETHVIKDFGGSKPGNFARYQNVKPGQVIHGDRVVTVVESKGPGVPAKGVIGKTVEEAAPLLKSMGVPVKVYKVASLHPGKIAATNPMPGEPLDENKEIFIGVGEEDKYPGDKPIPVELFDKDKDEAYKMMSDEGFKVRLVPKYSSRKHLGKIVGSYPGLGQSHMGDSDITLYYGADASETKKMFTSKKYYSENFTTVEVSTLTPFVGKWCTKSGDCLEFETGSAMDRDDPEKNNSLRLHGPHAMDDLVNDDKTQYYHSFGMWQFTQNLAGSAIKVYDDEKHNSLPMQNTLLFGDTGMVDIFRDGGDPYCGNTIYDVHSGLCVNGKFQDYQDLDRNYPDYSRNNFIDVPGVNKGITYKMRAYFVLVPVNAKLDELEASGFFKGKGKTKPDMDRPFILRRDPKYYSKSEREVASKDGDVRHNPFVPTEFNKPVPFAPAPDDSNVYYLVEKPFDWWFLKDREL